jgi:hypothetical protein
MPTLGEFIALARKYGCRRRVLVVDMGPSEQLRLAYLWRDADRFVELPDLRHNDRLTRAVVALLCAQLEIPPEDFGLEK